MFRNYISQDNSPTMGVRLSALLAHTECPGSGDGAAAWVVAVAVALGGALGQSADLVLVPEFGRLVRVKGDVVRAVAAAGVPNNREGPRGVSREELGDVVDVAARDEPARLRRAMSPDLAEREAFGDGLAWRVRCRLRACKRPHVSRPRLSKSGTRESLELQDTTRNDATKTSKKGALLLQ